MMTLLTVVFQTNKTTAHCLVVIPIYHRCSLVYMWKKPVVRCKHIHCLIVNLLVIFEHAQPVNRSDHLPLIFSGHSDVVMGLVSLNNDELHEKLRFLQYCEYEEQTRKCGLLIL